MDQNLSAALSCLVCLVPFALGWIIGSWFTRRRDRYGIIGALIPDFIHRIMERYD